jgi:hypothetical protein
MSTTVISPTTSPRGVMSLWADQIDSTKEHLLSLPVMHQHPAAAVVKKEKVSSSTSAVKESKPYHGRYVLKPDQEILQAFYRALLPINAKAAMHASQAFVDDIIHHQCNFTKIGTSTYEGFVQNHRLVVVRCDDDDTDGNAMDEYAILCEEEDIVQKFLICLRTMNVHVEEQQI